jgi:3-oxoacid CoA-transferase
MKKVPQISSREAANLVKDGDTILAGGFGMTGNPVHLLHALAETETCELTFIGNNVGEAYLGGGRLLNNGQLKKIVGSFFTSNPDAVKAAMGGSVTYELLPQGTLVEAIRAGGSGISGFYVKTSAETLIAKGKETKVFDGVLNVLEKAIRGNIAFIRAWKADTAGNLIYRMTEQNFNTAMAMAADIVVAEVEYIVPVGELDPNAIHTQGCFVDYLVEAKTTVENLGSSASIKSSKKKVDFGRLHMAKRALMELNKGDVVNLGIGIPTLIADLIKPEYGILLHTENGMLGVGPSPKDGGGAMEYPVNAGKTPVTSVSGGSYFDSSVSFAMIRGGHVDVAVMGGLQVDEQGNLANWAVPGKHLLGVGGAMDLASGARKLIITLTHNGPDGTSKIVPKCTLPITAKKVVDIIITNLAVFKFIDDKLTLIELMPGATLEDVRNKTDANFEELDNVFIIS